MIANRALVLVFVLGFVGQVICDCRLSCTNEYDCSSCDNGRTECSFAYSWSSSGECSQPTAATASCPTECSYNSDCWTCADDKTVCSFWKSECKTQEEADKDDEASTDAAEAAGTALGITFLLLVIGGPVVGICICICICVLCCRKQQQTVVIQQQQPQAYPAQTYPTVQSNAVGQPGPAFVPTAYPAKVEPNASPATLPA